MTEEKKIDRITMTYGVTAQEYPVVVYLNVGVDTEGKTVCEASFGGRLVATLLGNVAKFIMKRDAEKRGTTFVS